MVISKLNGKYKSVAITATIIGIYTFVQPAKVISNEMPTGGQVQSGNVAITGTGTNHMIIDSKSQKSICLLYTSPSPRDRTRSRMPSSA